MWRIFANKFPQTSKQTNLVFSLHDKRRARKLQCSKSYNLGKTLINQQGPIKHKVTHRDAPFGGKHETQTSPLVCGLAQMKSFYRNKLPQLTSFSVRWGFTSS
jgi:hypothetical protein